jgi:pimeloyl-ACP methyl ester carboxylesterase
VSSHPPFFALRFRTLPASVAEPIEELSDSSASSTLRKLRGSLGVLSSSNRSPDFLTTALQQLSWRELIHTSYFDVDAFVRLVALVFHRQGMSALRAEAWSPADRAAARVALRDMTISQVANAGDVERVGSGRAVSSDRDLKLSEQQKTLVAIAMFAGAVVAGIALTAVWLPLAWAVGIWLAGALAIIVLAQLVPVSLRGLDAVPAPTRTYEEAKRRFAALADQPEAIIHPRCVPYVLDHGKRVAKSYVLVHGISNCPYSMLDFAPRLHGLGHNVVIARMPFNGHLDNGTDALRHIKAEELREFADACIDIAAGLGERVHVVGISAGGVIAGWMAQNRSEIDRALLVAPAFGLSSLGTGLNAALLRLILFVPDLSIWKDPIRRARGESRPHSYKRMSTRGMGEVMRLGLGTLRQAKRRRAGALSVTVAMNAADTVVDPALPDRLAREWEIKSVPVTRYTFPREWKLPHEMIDGTQEGANISISHPKLAELAERPPDVPQRQPPRAPEPVDGRTKPPAGAKSDASTAEKMPQPMTQSA